MQCLFYFFILGSIQSRFSELLNYDSGVGLHGNHNKLCILRNISQPTKTNIKRIDWKSYAQGRQISLVNSGVSHKDAKPDNLQINSTTHSSLIYVLVH